MEPRQLRYFVAVCKALNFTKAAAQLRIEQPVLGRQVQDVRVPVPARCRQLPRQRFGIDHLLDLAWKDDERIKSTLAKEQCREKMRVGGFVMDLVIVTAH